MTPGGAEERDGVRVGWHNAEVLAVRTPEEGQAREDEGRECDGCNGAESRDRRWIVGEDSCAGRRWCVLVAQNYETSESEQGKNGSGSKALECAEIGYDIILDDGGLVFVVLHPLFTLDRLEPTFRLGAGD